MLIRNSAKPKFYSINRFAGIQSGQFNLKAANDINTIIKDVSLLDSRITDNKISLKVRFKVTNQPTEDTIIV